MTHTEILPYSEAWAPNEVAGWCVRINGKFVGWYVTYAAAALRASRGR